MKLSELIEALKEKKAKHGDVEVTVACDQEMHRDGKPNDDDIRMVEWIDANDDTEISNIMLCDRFTATELSCEFAEQ